MMRMLTAAAALLALAGCGGADDGNNAAAAAGGEKAGAAASGGAGVQLEPGEWEMKTEVVEVSAEGMPAGLAEGMKAQGSSTTRTCMTPEEAKGPKGDIFAGQNAECKSEGFSWSGGTIKGKTVCPGQGGLGATEMEMEGTYSARSIDMSMKSKTDMAGTPMTMEMRVTGRRVGDCPAGAEKAE